MQLDISTANVLDVYQALIGVVTPRPIAWVTTVSPGGVVNLAPFSFFNVFGVAPPVVVFSPGLRPDGSKKDTLRNVEATGEFVVNAAVADLAVQVNQSSKELPHDESEVEFTHLHATPSLKVKPPRITESPVHLECRVRQILPIGAANLVIGDVVLIHIRDEVLDETGRVDPRKLRTIARMGGDFWCHTSDLFTQQRP